MDSFLYETNVIRTAPASLASTNIPISLKKPNKSKVNYNKNRGKNISLYKLLELIVIEIIFENIKSPSAELNYYKKLRFVRDIDIKSNYKSLILLDKYLMK